MKTIITILLIISITIFLFVNFSSSNGDKTGIIVQEIKSPAGNSSSLPNLYASDNGTLYLSWVEKREKNKHALFYSIIKNESWTLPVIIAEGNNWLINWADFPSLTTFADGTIAAHFLDKSGSNTYAYDVNITISEQNEKFLSKPIVPHHDGTKTEHGFVSMLPYSDDLISIVWLDGRNYSKNHSNGTPKKEMTLRYATINKSGKVSNDKLLDSRVCDCCQTSAVRTQNGLIVVYRDRSKWEIRDIYYVRYKNGAWSKPQLLTADGWIINGCPVNGPAIDATGKNVAVAWYTAAKQVPKIKVIFSNDEGESFGSTILVDDGDPIGRVDVILLSEKTALVSWIESTDYQAELKIRKVNQDGSMDKSMIVTKLTASRAGGFPKMEAIHDKIYFAWTQTGKTSRVRTAMVKISNN